MARDRFEPRYPCKRFAAGEGKRIGCSGYSYRGFELCSMYHSPEKRVIWEAVDIRTGNGDFHAHRKRDIKKLIDESYG